MSEPQGPISAIAQPFTQMAAEHLNAPPLTKNRNRAIWGTWALTAGGYYAWTYYVIERRPGVPALVGGYIAQLHQPFDDSWPFYAWAGVMLISVLWIVVGMRGARGPRDTMTAFWSVAWIVLFGAALWFRWYIDDYPLVDWFLMGIYITGIAAWGMSLFLALRGPGGGAVQLVQQQIARQSRAFRVGKQREF